MCKFQEKKLFIYTSGILVYPNSQSHAYEEEDSTQLKGWVIGDRVQYEQDVINSQHVYGVVVRPAFVFGKKSHNFVYYFDQATKGKVVVAGSKDVGWSEIHIDDLVDGYLRIVESPVSIVTGQIFNFADDSRYTNVQIAERFAKVAGYKGTIEVDEKLGREFSNKTVYVDCRKAQRLLSWRPRHKLLLDQAEVLYRSWLANPNRKSQFTSTKSEPKEEKQK